MSNCCSCNVSPAPSSCRQTITSADLATLLYLQGLDANLCTKFEAVVPGLSLVDCAGNPIAIGTPVVACAEFATELCDALAALLLAGPLTLGVTEVVGADCLTYTVPETPIAVIDTNCIDLTSSGTFGHTIQADLVISPTVGNQATCTASGLFVAPAADLCDELAALPFFGVAVPGVTKIVANDCNVYDLPAGAADVVIITADGDCVDLSAVQGPVGTWTISADAIISPNAGNELSCVGNGLYSPDTVISGQDTACIDIEVVESPANNFVITVDPIISGAGGNILTCTPEGLYVPTTPVTNVSISAVDSDCLNLDVVEGPDNTFVISGDVIVSPVLGNALICSAQGLLVVPGLPADPVGITAIDTNCINMTVDNPIINQFEISAVPIISPAVGNILECTVDGLFVPTGTAVTVSATDTATVDTTVTPVGSNYDVSSTVIINPTAPTFPLGCQGLTATVSGLSVPPEHFSFNGQTAAGAQIVNADGVQTGENFSGPIHTINIPAIGPCREASLMLLIDIPAGELSGLGLNLTHMSYTVIENANLPGVFVIVNNPLATQSIFRKPVAVGEDSDSATTYPKGTFTREFTLPVNFPGGTYTVQVGATMELSDPPGSHMSVDDSKVSFFLVSR